ncbi:pyridoxamine 5'-phosphate oxidase [Amycolatopsis xylanica]|uniref:Pyridoxamine 5'-phosphate oxidase n=1 Tax=Amycolatopsis xylanica TaxID=589385 RepID=A0A1H3AUN6_9PSEU|nr:pyridoxal 5'-phosphate synthase [Amycolatopsis xylanica]SDX33450.1 pyridoxamine 5'-phosphate oxidase [Amycolatopsis xylanica]
MFRWPSFPDELPGFDTEAAPEKPHDLFLEWVAEAGEHVLAPHAVTLSTVDEDGPDARVVVLRGVDDDGWAFSTSLDSPKAAQLDQDSRAALTFFWPGRGRQVRLRGRVTRASADASFDDFDNRSPLSKAEVLLGHQSEVLESHAELVRAGAEVERALRENPELRPVSWQRYVFAPTVAEFWQGAIDRRHVRLRYRLENGGWVRELLWP